MVVKLSKKRTLISISLQKPTCFSFLDVIMLPFFGPILAAKDTLLAIYFPKEKQDNNAHEQNSSLFAIRRYHFSCCPKQIGFVEFCKCHFHSLLWCSKQESAPLVMAKTKDVAWWCRSLMQNASYYNGHINLVICFYNRV